MCEYVNMFDYTRNAVNEVLFEDWSEYELLPSPEWTDDFIFWQESNQNEPHTMKKDTHGYEIRAELNCEKKKITFLERPTT